jgi:hypothetical protein
MNTQNERKFEFNEVTKKVLTVIGLALVLVVPLMQVESQIGTRREIIYFSGDE